MMTTIKEIQDRQASRSAVCSGSGQTMRKTFGAVAERAHEDVEALLDQVDALTAQLTSAQKTNETLARELEAASRVVARPGHRISFEQLLTPDEGAQVDAFVDEVKASIAPGEDGRDLSGAEDTLLTPVYGGHVFAGTWEQFEQQREATCAACGLPVRSKSSTPSRASAPCSGWPSAIAGDALRRVVRAVTRDRDEGAKPNGPHELAVQRFAEAFNRLCDLIDAGKAPRDELCAAAGTAARGFVLMLNRKADELRALELALAASDPHKALRSFMAALPSTDMARERGPVEDAFAKLDAAIEEHGGTVAIAAAAEELADVIRARLREVATFALAWRDTVREAARVAQSKGGFTGRAMVDPHGVLAQDLMHAHLNAPAGRTIEERIARETTTSFGPPPGNGQL